MAMDLISHRSSSLNPNAPLFVPLAYRTVEDFSDQWWSLVQSSPWFRDYWLQERFQDPEIDSMFSDLDDTVFPDDDDLFNDYQQKEEKKSYSKDLISLGALKWGNGRAVADVPRYVEKAPKIVNVKMSPRKIQQPR